MKLLKKDPVKPPKKVPVKLPKKVPAWIWPLGVAAASLGGLATLVLRGCWHQFGWPQRVSTADLGHHGHETYSYQACTKCGIKRLFDDKAFCPYGGYGYDVKELIARERAEHIRRLRKEQHPQAAAEVSHTDHPTAS